MSDIVDPIDGLIRYVNEIKPFHSKVIEVLTEYVYEEELNVTMSENSLLDVGIFIDRVDVDADLNATKYSGNFDVGPYDSARYFPVIAINTTQTDGAFTAPAPGAPNKKGYNADINQVTLAGDQTAIYRPGRNIIVELVKHDTTTGMDGNSIINTYTIVSSTYVTTGQTNGISDTPHTRLILSGLVDETTLSIAANEVWSANVKLTPVNVSSVVVSTSANTNTGRIRYTTVPTDGTTTFGPGTLETPLFVPTSPTTIGDGNISKLDNYIVLSGDSTGSYPYGSTLIMLLTNGKQDQYTVSSSYFDGTDTIIEVIEELDTTADYTGAQVVEGFFGYSDSYIVPSSISAIPEGLTQTTITESIRFGWNDGTDEVINFAQFLIKETQAANTILLASDGRDPEDFFQVGDTINIIEQDAGNNGQHVVTSITPVTDGTEVVVSTSLNISSDTGFLETT